MTNIRNRFKPFRMGQIVINPSVLKVVKPCLIWRCLVAHAQGSWGIVPSLIAQDNNQATFQHGEIISAHLIDPSDLYVGNVPYCFWIVTKADRSVTTVRLPDDD